MEGSSRRELLISRGWLQTVLVVVLVGFFVLGLLAYRTYQAKPPIPQRVVDPTGPMETALLAALLSGTVLVGAWLMRDLRANPASFRTPSAAPPSRPDRSL